MAKPIQPVKAMKTHLLFLCGLFAAAAVIAGARPIPQPLPNHPGNVFVAAETVVVPLSNARPWRLVDYDSKTIAEGDGDKAELGRLAAGYYELRGVVDGKASKTLTTIGVVEPLRAPTPETSPIGIDVAMAWFYTGERMEQSANLCALAGVNWVRDRLRWDEMEPEKGRFAPANKYDDTARIESKAGLRVLQVHHNTPPWATTTPQRQPPDLRDAYHFMREMARRWKGQVQAFEPWNEADVENFGGHIGVEMASLQKASYLGLKAGNPDVIVCQNVFALVQPNMLADLAANRAWPYFDTFNFHHYCGPDNYPNVYAAFRPFTAGKPMWVTEFNAPVHWAGEEQEPTESDLRVQAERVTEVFAASLHEGPAAAFYFMLPHYCEGETQFGILHKDLTPRPAYLALAAVGRLLADAHPLGKMPTAATTCAYVFRASPDGRESDVLVAWTTGGEASLELPGVPSALYDHLGRAKFQVQGEPKTALKISTAPLFAVFDKNAISTVALQSAPQPLALKTEKPSPIVLQVLAPQEKTALSLSACRISSEKPEALRVFAYNFGDRKYSGRFAITAPAGWTVQFPSQIELAPGERKELSLTVDSHSGSTAPVESIRIQGEFGDAGQPVLSVRVTPTPFKLREGQALNLPFVTNQSRWQPLNSGGSEMVLTNSNGAILVKAKLNPGDRWVYPILTLNKVERPGADFDAFVVTLTALEGEGTYRAIMDEENGSSYAIDFVPQPKPGETVEAIAVLSTSVYGQGWSKPDDNGKLDPDKIKSLKIGCSLKGESVKFSFKNPRWVKTKVP
jgi:hypothetical protein